MVSRYSPPRSHHHNRRCHRCPGLDFLVTRSFPDWPAKMLKSTTPSPDSSPSIYASALPSTLPTSPNESDNFVDIEKGANEKALLVDEKAAAAAPYDFMNTAPYDFMNTSPDDFTDIEQGFNENPLPVEEDVTATSLEDISDYSLINSSDITVSFERVPRRLRHMQCLRRL